MRTWLIVVSILIAASSVLRAQNLPPILKTTKPKRGIYTSFDEFLNDSPSVQSDFKLQERSRSKQYWAGGSDYALMIPDGIGGMKKANKYWGVCDGDSVYINVSNYQKSRGYIKLLQLGRFCYTKGITSDSREGDGGAVVIGVVVGGAVGGAVVGALSSINQEAAFIFNINNGKFIMLTPDVLNKILERDDELSQAYSQVDKKAKDDPDLMLDFIAKFNQRHTGEIKRERLAKIILYRRDKRERHDTLTVITGDSLRYTLGVNEFEQFEAPKPSITLCWSGQCETFPVSVESPNYFQCMFRENDKPDIVSRDTKEGDYYLRQLKYLAEHPQE